MQQGKHKPLEKIEWKLKDQNQLIMESIWNLVQDIWNQEAILEGVVSSSRIGSLRSYKKNSKYNFEKNKS